MPSALLTALLLGPLVQAAPEGSWRDVVLPAGFELDLATGEVTTRPEAGTAGLLQFSDGRLSATVPLELLPQVDPPARGLAGVVVPSTRLERPTPSEESSAETSDPAGVEDDGRAWRRAVERGDELLFDLGDAGWGYLRVLALGRDRIELEVVVCEAEEVAIERAPWSLEAHPGRAGVELRWPGVAGARYRVDRAILTGADGHRRWTALGTAAPGADGVGTWTDDTDLEGRLAVYRVARVDGERVAFGSRARGTWPLWSAEEGIVLRQGQYISLLSGETTAEGHDLRVEVVNASGAQVTCPDGVLMHSQNAGSARPWVVTPPELGPSPAERLYLPAGRDASVRLAEGIYARIFLVSSDEAGGGVELRRQIDLEGGLLFPEPPSPPAVGWSAERGAELTFPPFAEQLFGEPLEPAPGIVVEREAPYDSGEWTLVRVGAPGERVLLDAVGVDPAAGPGGLHTVRYRFRNRWLGRVDSLPSEPVVVVAGDDGGPLTETAVREALLWLGDPDYERRRAARRVIERLGERVWPQLRDAMGSDDPEIATVVAEIMRGAAATSETGGGAGGPPAEFGAPAALVLRARAAELGLEAPAPEGFLADKGLARVRALLDTRARREAPVAAWRAVLEEADPEPGVRLLARMLIEREPDPHADRAVWRVREREAGAERRGPSRLAEWTQFFADEPGVPQTLRLVADELDPARPRAALILLEVLWQLALARADREGEQEAIDRAQLALSFVHAWEERGESLYLDAAASLFDDARVRVRALRDLADLRLGRLEGAETAPGRTREELPEASVEVLQARLDELATAGLSDVDLVLPPGDYGVGEAGGRTVLSIEVPGLRLLAAGKANLNVTIRVAEVEGVVIEGFAIRSPTTVAVTAQRGSVLVRDCILSSSNTHVQGYDAVVEVVRCHFESSAGRPVNGARTSGTGGLLLVRDCDFYVEGAAASVGGIGFLDGCLVSAGRRPAVDCAVGSHVTVVDTYVRSEGVALSKMAAGLLVGVVVDTEAPAARGLGIDVELCPKSLFATGNLGDLETRERLPGCPLEY